MGKYIKIAFMNRWNLLGVVGAAGFALLSGRADIFLPLVFAAEAAYLGLVGTHPKFQSFVDIQEAEAVRGQQTESSEQSLRRILQSLQFEDRTRFEQLRRRCLDLRQIATDLKQSANEGSSLDEMQLAGLDRLLWVFVRLLFTRQSLNRFLEHTDVQAIHADMKRIEERLRAFPPANTNEHAQKMREALEDNLQTSRDRLANVDKAKANHEFVELELDRLENKIHTLSELAVNRQEPDYISSQVNQVTASMMNTEKTIHELDFATGLGSVDDQAPALLRDIQPQS